MNTTEYFKRTIQAYLEERTMEDELFAAKYDSSLWWLGWDIWLSAWSVKSYWEL